MERMLTIDPGSTESLLNVTYPSRGKTWMVDASSSLAVSSIDCQSYETDWIRRQVWMYLTPDDLE